MTDYLIKISSNQEEYYRQETQCPNVNVWAPVLPTICPSKDDIIGWVSQQGKLIAYAVIQEVGDKSIDDAWKRYGRGNGYINKDAFIKAVSEHPIAEKQGTIGCLMMSDIVWLDQPYTLSKVPPFSPTNLCCRASVDIPLQNTSSDGDFRLVADPVDKKQVASNSGRQGQAEFHRMIAAAYHHRCCISGASDPEVLQAAHIQEYRSQASNHVQNGLLLRADLHLLFDNGLLAIEPVSKSDGVHYYVRLGTGIHTQQYLKYADKEISLPNNIAEYPSIKALQEKLKEFRG